MSSSSRNEAIYQRQCADTRQHTAIGAEMHRAIEKFPNWPNDMLHAVAIIGEEYGELVKDVLQLHYEPHKGKSLETIRAEAIQTICMLQRFLNSLEAGAYSVHPGQYAQHQTTEVAAGTAAARVDDHYKGTNANAQA